MRSTTMLYTRHAVLSTMLGLTLTNCATKSQTGAVVGGAGGAVIGGVIGHSTGNTAAGAIIGAAAGGIVGGIIGAEMDKQAKELKQNIPGARVERVGEGIAVTFESGLLFDFDSDVIRPEAAKNLRALAKSLDKYPGSDLLIVGHTDQVGAASYNQKLSQNRADAAMRYLVAQGVRQGRVATKGMGETEPIAPNETEAGRQQNRRVEVAIYASDAHKKEVAKQNPS
ncbi:MAG TPA: OmpA family protein [Gemmatimonadales bacterium]|nr:OmpA family protein [Gemmatimonadales bacterium]